jgi:hypothetical protein
MYFGFGGGRMIATHVTDRRKEPLVDVDQVTPRSDADGSLFRELHDVLQRHGALQRFGICLLHQHFELADDEVMLEQTDKANRRQLMRPVKIKTLDLDNMLETSWRLDNGKPAMVCLCYMNGDIHDHVYWPSAGDDQ